MSDSSNLILNSDGSIYHLGLLPNEIANTIFLVGDPDRVPEVSKYFDKIVVKKHRREICSHTGIYKGKPLMCISTGMGTDNIDIVLNELDALANIDLKTGEPFKKLTQLNFIRLGTSGSLQADIKVGSILASEIGIGLDSLGIYYEHPQLGITEKLLDHFSMKQIPINPYGIEASALLLSKVDGSVLKGITVTCPGFYAPQGRRLRAASTFLQHNILDALITFNDENKRLTNLEMETAGIYLIAKALGHKALSLNALLANRITGEFSEKPKDVVSKMIEMAINAVITED